jgi:hypothetical protein
VPFWRQSSRLPLKYIRHLGGQSKHIERTSGCTRNAPRCGRFGSHGRRNPAQSPARTLSGRGNDMLANEPASWQRQEQSPEPDRAHRWRGLGTADRLAHGSDELAQMARHAPRYAGAGCVRQGARPRLHTRHTRWRMCTTGAVTASGQTVACSGQGQSDPAGPALNPSQGAWHRRLNERARGAPEKV